MIRLLRSSLAAAIAAIPLLLASAAAAAPATTEIIRVTEYFDEVTGADTCLGESLHLQGEVTFFLRSTVTAGGNPLTGGTPSPT